VLTVDGLAKTGGYAGTETHVDAASGTSAVLLFVEEADRLVAVPLTSVAQVEIAEEFDRAGDVIRDVAAALTGEWQTELPMTRTVVAGTHAYLEVTVTPHRLPCDDA